MDEKSQAYFNSIIAKDPGELNREEILFLQARRSYLKKVQSEEYKDVLSKKFEPAEPVKEVVAETPDYLKPPKQEVSYRELLKQAKGLGYKGPRLKRSELETYIQDHKKAE